MARLEEDIFLVAALRTPIGRWNGVDVEHAVPADARAMGHAHGRRRSHRRPGADGFLCPLADEMMGSTAETLADRYAISRGEQDRFAVGSQTRAGRAYAANRFADEIVPVRVAGKKGEMVIDRDEHPRFDASLGSMAKLEPAFRKNGTVHTGNSSGVTDGAASILVANAAADGATVDGGMGLSMVVERR